MSVRTRFAPSPTGDLHLGNVRIAVFNWLFSRHHGGRMVLRLEDTDVGRNEPGAEERIMADLRWLGLDWDEGPDLGGPHDPYRQSERRGAYREAADQLVEGGRAYPCYCTPEELSRDAEEVEGEEKVVRYSGRCRNLTPEERRAFEDEGRLPVIRFRIPEGDIQVEDEIRGSITFPGKDITDFVILRQDGTPTYNFAVVVDDVSMEISHVIRGAGHLSNTPKQALLFDAMDRPRPRFAHLPTVLGEDRRKLSKREGAAGVSRLRQEGYHPEAVVNYLSLLGWSHPEEREVLTRQELTESVDLDRVGAADTVFDEEKLRWISAQHIAGMELDELARAVEPFLDRERYPLEGASLRRAVDALRTRLHTFSEINDHLHLIFPDADRELEAVREQVRTDPEARKVLEGTREKLAALDGWDAPALGAAVREAGKEVGARGPALFHPIRKALTGASSGPDLGKILAAVGRQESLERIDSTLAG